MKPPINRRHLLRGGLLAAGVAAPLVAFAAAQPAAAGENRDGLAAMGSAMGKESAIDGGSAPSNLSAGPIGVNATLTGVQFTGTLGPGQIGTWFTFNWPASWHVVWHAVSTTPAPGVIQVSSSWSVERASAAYITYWVTIRNLSGGTINIEARYGVLNLG